MKKPSSILVSFVFLLLSFGSLQGQELGSCIPDNSTLDTELQNILRAKGFWTNRVDSPHTILVQEVLELLPYECKKYHDTTIARVYHNLGVSFNRKRKYRQARWYYSQAIQIREAHLTPNHPDVVKSYNNLGSSFLRATQNGRGYFLDSAYWALNLSIERNLSRTTPTTLLGTTYLYRSRVAEEQREVELTRKDLLSAIEHLKDQAGKERTLAIAYGDLSFLFATSSEQQELGLGYALEALTYFENQSLNTWQDSLLKANFLITAGTACTEIERYDKAMEYYQQALALKAPFELDLPEDVAGILINMGRAYHLMGSFPEARDILLSALPLLDSSTNPTLLAQAYDNLGDTWTGLNQDELALNAYHLAVMHSVPGFEDPNPLAVPSLAGKKLHDDRGLLTSLFSKAKTLQQISQNDPRQSEYLLAAYHAFMGLDTLIQAIRERYQAEAKEALVAEAKPIYEHGIEVCLALSTETGEDHYQQMAFSLSEKSKSMILLDAVQQSQAIRAILPTSVQEELKILLARKEYYEALWEEGNTEVINSLNPQDSVTKYSLQTTRILQRLQQQAPFLFGTKVPDITDIQQDLLQSSDQGLMEYFVGERNLYLFVVTKDRFISQQVPNNFGLQSLIEDLRFAVSSQQARDSIGSYAPVLYKQARMLYQHLLGPLGDISQLPDRWLIIRDDVLGFLPFELLLTEEWDNHKDFVHFPYLIRQKAISYGFSATLQLEFANNNVQPLKRFAAFAPIQFDQLTSQEEGQEIAMLPPLPNTGYEVDEIAFQGDEQIFEKKEASWASFQQKAPDYWILYVASHNIVSSEDPNMNGIVFYDKILRTADLYFLQLNAELIVLRACETNMGKLISGEGIASIASGFAYTGAKSIFSTQWVVPEASAFMKSFLKYLYEGKSKDVALQLAKLESIENDYAFSWAGYEISGDAQAAHFSRDTWNLRTIILGLLGVLALSVIALVYRRRQEEKRRKLGMR